MLLPLSSEKRFQALCSSCNINENNPVKLIKKECLRFSPDTGNTVKHII